MFVSLIVLFISWLSGLINKSDPRGAISRLTNPLASTTRPLVSAPQQLHTSIATISSSTARGTMASQKEDPSGSLENHLTPTLFQNLNDFWFEHFEHEDDYIMPKPIHSKRWFMGGQELDNICVQRYAPALEAIRNSGITTGDEILSIAQPRGPLDWLGLVILLDQIPRNCYRGPRSEVVFNFFDPLAQQIALKAIAQGIPDQSPEIRWHFAYRNWFYMPLMHSESMSDHEKAVEEFGLFQKDVLYLAESQGSATENKLEKRAREVVQKDVEAAKQVGDRYMSFEKSHQAIIKQFGRYPHRNKVLGREATAAETEYLENGGETFS